MTGIPVYNLYNLFIGGVKTFNYEEGTKWDAFVRGYSSSYIMGAFKSAVQNNGDRTANSLLSLELAMYKSGKATTDVVNELRELYSQGYDVIPSSYGTYYTNDSGEKTDFTQEQIKLFKQTYQGANKAVSDLMKVTEYRTATQEEKAKYIKGLYEAYYGAAKGKAIGSTNGLSKLAKILYYTDGNISLGKYIVALKKIASIEATASKTKKDLTLDYINKLTTLSKQEKLLLMYLNGYKLTDQNLNMLITYLASRGINKKGLADLLGQ